jgi:hypothetical protein
VQRARRLRPLVRHPELGRLAHSFQRDDARACVREQRRIVRQRDLVRHDHVAE